MDADVIVVGAGPVGLTAALLLARHGLAIRVLERRAAPSDGPRAVSVDDEGMRIWQTCGLDALVREECQGGAEGRCMCTYLDERGEPFLRLHQRRTDLGHLLAAAIHQGRVETRLRDAALAAGIDLRTGCTVHAIEQDEERVVITAIDAAGRPVRATAPWLIACDGAGSTVRRRLGIGMEGRELPHPWLIANLVDDGEPGHVMIRCGARGAAVTMPIPHGLRRVEVRLPRHDGGAWLHDEARVRTALARGWEAAHAAPIASVSHRRFRAAAASRWRDGRIFLAGDAAHVMPPFAGQGLGAGLRDAANLTFKLAGVSQGWLPHAVLETYEEERRPHVARMTRLACRLGALMSPPTRLGGLAMHAAVRAIGASTRLAAGWLLRGPAIRPVLTSGFLEPSAASGRYLPQPLVRRHDGRAVPLDELLGPRLSWIALGPDADSARSSAHASASRGDTVLVEGREFHDDDFVLRRRYGAGSTLLVRPDRVVHTHWRAWARSIPSDTSVACPSCPSHSSFEPIRPGSSSRPADLSAIGPVVAEWRARIR